LCRRVITSTCLCYHVDVFFEVGSCGRVITFACF
jgi:hypothetical protein